MMRRPHLDADIAALDASQYWKFRLQRKRAELRRQRVLWARPAKKVRAI